jgi:hypothetical protein
MKRRIHLKENLNKLCNRSVAQLVLCAHDMLRTRKTIVPAAYATPDIRMMQFSSYSLPFGSGKGPLSSLLPFIPQDRKHWKQERRTYKKRNDLSVHNNGRMQPAPIVCSFRSHSSRSSEPHTLDFSAMYTKSAPINERSTRCTPTPQLS